MPEEGRECLVRFLHWIGVLNLELETQRLLKENGNGKLDKQRALVKAEIETLEGYLGTIGDEVDKLKRKLN